MVSTPPKARWASASPARSTAASRAPSCRPAARAPHVGPRRARTPRGPAPRRHAGWPPRRGRPRAAPRPRRAAGRARRASARGRRGPRGRPATGPPAVRHAAARPRPAGAFLDETGLAAAEPDDGRQEQAASGTEHQADRCPGRHGGARDLEQRHGRGDRPRPRRLPRARTEDDDAHERNGDRHRPRGDDDGGPGDDHDPGRGEQQALPSRGDTEHPGGERHRPGHPHPRGVPGGRPGAHEPVRDHQDAEQVQRPGEHGAGPVARGRGPRSGGAPRVRTAGHRTIMPLAARGTRWSTTSARAARFSARTSRIAPVEVSRCAPRCPPTTSSPMRTATRSSHSPRPPSRCAPAASGRGRRGSWSRGTGSSTPSRDRRRPRAGPRCRGGARRASSRWRPTARAPRPPTAEDERGTPDACRVERPPGRLPVRQEADEDETDDGVRDELGGHGVPSDGVSGGGPRPVLPAS